MQKTCDRDADDGCVPPWLAEALAFAVAILIAGSLARLIAMSIGGWSGGQPVSLSEAGEVFFFALAGVPAGLAMVAIRLAFSEKAKATPSSRYGEAFAALGIFIGVGVGILIGLVTVPGFGFMCITIPDDMFHLLFDTSSPLPGP